ncbi:MAG: glycerol kinase GlpK [Gammaproteobacteria bacterium]|nr:glycerol kinase GlpK [Gammaproteobacteria bacterium]MDH3449594.1 glycerol kinase GlpK [Gammaproteobacteria bacterium]
MSQYILSIDQGTTSSRAMLFDEQGQALFTAQQEFTQHFPRDGWVEHNAEEIWTTTLEVVRKALAKAKEDDRRIAAIGITNQRETTVLWDRASGEPIYHAIVWQDRRTAEYCESLRAQNYEALVTDRTGLLLDPYFSGTKVNWILENVSGARARAEKGEILFGTIDCFLIWRLTGGRVHATDATNASRTLMFDIHEQRWDRDLLDMLSVPEAMLPEVLDCADDYGSTSKSLLGAEIPIAGVAGDQQSALIGQACFETGMIKSTYGTGCFMVLNTGAQALKSKNRLLTTVGYRINGETTYALEGSIFVAGAAVQWLRDGIGIIDSAQQTEAMAASLDSNKGIYMVPAFTGLGAPHWDPDARGAISGITRDTGPAEIVRATLESVCYQTFDLLEAKRRDGITPTRLRVDGGMVRNNWLCGFLADVLDIIVERPVQTETTALGAAYLAGLQVGMFTSLDDIAKRWQAEREFEPSMEASQRKLLLADWHDAVIKVKTRRKD